MKWRKTSRILISVHSSDYFFSSILDKFLQRVNRVCDFWWRQCFFCNISSKVVFLFFYCHFKNCLVFVVFQVEINVKRAKRASLFSVFFVPFSLRHFPLLKIKLLAHFSSQIDPKYQCSFFPKTFSLLKIKLLAPFSYVFFLFLHFPPFQFKGLVRAFTCPYVPVRASIFKKFHFIYMLSD